MTEQPWAGRAHIRPRRRKLLRWGAFGVAAALALLILLVLVALSPYRIPSSAMEPTLNCAKPAVGCLGSSNDWVLACRICLKFSSPSRGDVIVFSTPQAALIHCAAGGTLVKRVIGLPGETVKEDNKGFIWIRGPDAKRFVKLDEPYVSPQARERDSYNHKRVWSVPAKSYFMVGDNRSESCDSRQWGSVPAGNLIGPLIVRYWPLSRLGFL